MHELLGDQEPRVDGIHRPRSRAVVGRGGPDSYDEEVPFSPILNILLKVLGPAMLGFGTIFQPKANATDHWSTSPQIVIRVDASHDDSRDPPPDGEPRAERERVTAIPPHSSRGDRDVRV